MEKIWNLPAVHFVPFTEVVENRPVLVVTSTSAWNAVKDNLGGMNLVEVVEVTEATVESWNALALEVGHHAYEALYAVGGGLAADVGKYLAAREGLPLTVMPTALSVDAFLTPVSGARREGLVEYLEAKSPDRIILDLEIICRAPVSIRAAGITDVLSIATGCWDWKFAHEQGLNPPGMEFLPWAYGCAQSILCGALDCAEAAGRGDREGLKTLFDCLAMEVQLCNQLGHSRPEEGSEHYFAYCVENFAGPGRPHGELVGPGILLMADRQGQETEKLEGALRACGIPLDQIPQDMVDQAIRRLPSYCREHKLPYGIAHTLEG